MCGSLSVADVAMKAASAIVRDGLGAGCSTASVECAAFTLR